MTVIEVVRKYNLEDCVKDYKNQYGQPCNLTNIDKLKQTEVKSIDINFPTNLVTITIIQDI